MDDLSDVDVARIVADFIERGLVPNNDKATALVKRFRLHSAWNEQHERWLVSPRNVGVNFGILDMRIGVGENVNSAIVECVAKRQKASKQ